MQQTSYRSISTYSELISKCMDRILAKGLTSWSLSALSCFLMRADSKCCGKKKFTDNIINISLDKAHVIKEWGGTICSNYLWTGPLRYCFPRTIPFHLGSATLRPQMEPELHANLHLCPEMTSVIWCNTDWHNIFLVVKEMKHPLNSYKDLAFIIKKNLKPGGILPPKFLIFFNSWGGVQGGAECLRTHLSLELRDKVRWFHSGMTDEYQEEEMHALLVGDVMGEGATDVAGMVSSEPIS